MDSALLPTTVEKLKASSGKGKGKKEKDNNKKEDDAAADAANGGSGAEPIRVYLSFKRFVFDPEKKMIQWSVLCTNAMTKFE